MDGWVGVCMGELCPFQNCLIVKTGNTLSMLENWGQINWHLFHYRKLKFYSASTHRYMNKLVTPLAVHYPTYRDNISQSHAIDRRFRTWGHGPIPCRRPVGCRTKVKPITMETISPRWLWLVRDRPDRMLRSDFWTDFKTLKVIITLIAAFVCHLQTDTTQTSRSWFLGHLRYCSRYRHCLLIHPYNCYVQQNQSTRKHQDRDRPTICRGNTS